MRHLPRVLRIFVPGFLLAWIGCGSTAPTTPTPSPTPHTEPTTLAWGLLAAVPGGPRVYSTSYDDRIVRALHVQVGRWAVYP